MSDNCARSENANYIELLKMILEYGYKEYKHLAIDRQRIQLTYLKTYISLSTVIIGAVVSAMLFLKILPGGSWPSPEKNPYEFLSFVLTAISFLLAVSIFIGGLNLLRGRKDRPFPFGDIKATVDWLKEVEEFMSADSDRGLEREFMNSLIDSVTSSLDELIEITTYTGVILRRMSLGLIFSVSFALVGVLICLFT